VSEREYIIVWKRERNLRGRKRERMGRRKERKKRTPNDGRNREGLFRRHTSDGRLCWGGRQGFFFFFFTFCVASLLLSISPKYRKRQGPEYMPGKRGDPPNLFFFSAAGVYIRSSSSFSFTVLVLILALRYYPFRIGRDEEL